MKAVCTCAYATAGWFTTHETTSAGPAEPNRLVRPWPDHAHAH